MVMPNSSTGTSSPRQASAGGPAGQRRPWRWPATAARSTASGWPAVRAGGSACGCRRAGSATKIRPSRPRRGRPAARAGRWSIAAAYSSRSRSICSVSERLARLGQRLARPSSSTSTSARRPGRPCPWPPWSLVVERERVGFQPRLEPGEQAVGHRRQARRACGGCRGSPCRRRSARR